MASLEEAAASPGVAVFASDEDQIAQTENQVTGVGLDPIPQVVGDGLGVALECTRDPGRVDRRRGAALLLVSLLLLLRLLRAST
jgi:hypothetical protein